MKKKYIALIPVGIIAAILIANFFLQSKSQEEHYRLVYESLNQNGNLDTIPEKLVRELFTKAADITQLRKNIIVNKKYSDSDLNIYIIDVASYKNTDDQFLNQLIQATKSNMITLEPNVILIDNSLLYSMILESSNTMVNDLQLMQFFGHNLGLTGGDRKLKTKEDFFDEAERVTTINSFLRLGNLAEDHIGESRVAYESGRELMKASNAYDFDNKVFSFFIPIFVHELAHVKEGSFGGFLENDGISFSELFNSFDRKKEAKADALAINSLNKLLKRDTTGLYLLDIRQVDAFTEYWRDSVLISLFEGFRGLPAQHNLITIKQRNYEDLTDEQRKYPFHYFDRIQEAYYNPFPLLTEKEYNDIKTKIKKEVVTASHDHLYLRMLLFKQHIYSHMKGDIDNPKMARADLALLPFFFSILGDTVPDKDIEYAFGVNYKDNIGVSWKAIEPKLNKYFNFEKSSFYKTLSGKIGKSNNAKFNNYIEIFGNEQVKKIRLVFQYKSSGNYQTVEYLQNLTSELCSVVAPEYSPQDISRDFLELSINQYPMFKTNFENINIEFKRINQSDFYSLTIQPNITSPQLARASRS